jgi:hypothetical protein
MYKHFIHPTDMTKIRQCSETQLTESPISFYGGEQSEQAYNIQL